MSSSNEVVSVIVAAAQSVAKVFVIGAVGYGAVLFPRQAPLLPRTEVSTVARFGFNTLVLSLIYSTTAVAVNPDSFSKYWFVVLAPFYVLGVSYATATVLGRWTPGLHIAHPHDFAALRIAATFPNIVALPILIFPSLCEYPVVYTNFGGIISSSSADAATNAGDAVDSSATFQQQCADEATAMIFCYFFGWSLLFWSLGYPQLMAAARDMQASMLSSSSTTTASKSSNVSSRLPLQENADCNDNDNVRDDAAEFTIEEDGSSIGVQRLEQGETPIGVVAGVTFSKEENDATSSSALPPPPPSVLHNVLQAVRQTCTSPGFIALALGTLTGCIPPLRDALFETGGALRFLGDAIQTMGSASAPISTMVVAASLVPQQQQATHPDDSNNMSNTRSSAAGTTASTTLSTEGRGDDVYSNRSSSNESAEPEEELTILRPPTIPTENPIMSDPNFGPHQPRQRRSSLLRLGSSLRRSSVQLLDHVKKQQHQHRSNPEQRRLLVWFTLSRLIVAPALVFATLVVLEQTTVGRSFLKHVSPLSKLVVLVNAVLPGALIVVVLLKSQPALADSAGAVAKVYLPTYLLSIVTIAAWTALALGITLPAPSDDGEF